ncbi:uncharacterized protein LOC100123696 isoform X3 [Nasonia vitripennis]|uniref:F-box domain-containing protein n=1 Tax=Nasonia vitripennis TaxID=7425 RepID=A0A7M7ISK1_NASVI|nr:uncharacterized protein LOC100123696 isoform X3 [Nasonia vitripennis]
MENLPNVSAELTAEFVLSHVIDDVCRFLEIKDLYSVAKVCRSWKDAALHEMSKIGPKVTVMPFFSKPMNTNCDSKINLLDRAHTKPHTALLFFNRYHLSYAFQQRCLDYVINAYKEQLECNVIALDSEETYFDTNPRAYPEDYDNYEFGYDRGTNIARKLLTMIQKNHEQTKYSIWGNECYSLKKVDYDPSDSQTIKEPAVVGIRICGPSIDSWSFILNANMKLDKFEEQLLKFKENIKLKRHSLGLVCGPALAPSAINGELQESSLFMNLIKKIFPEIPFIGQFSYEFYFNAYGCDSTSNDSKTVVSLMAVSLMIITHD